MTLELTRICVAPGHQNACSKLLGRLKQIGQLMGYARIKTYTLLEESGASLRAVGAMPERHCPPSRWDRPGSSWQPVYEKEKTRWELLAHEVRGACERPPPSPGRGDRPERSS